MKLRWLSLFSVLDRKLARDLWGMKGQALAIALVIAGGVAVQLVAEGMLSSLGETRRAYYERYRFADVWAPVVRAPDALISRIRSIDGVLAAETRVRVSALFDMPGMEEPATGELISLPVSREPSVNAVFLVEGRFPAAGQADEAVVLETFAQAHGLTLGSDVTATVYGRRRTMVVVGIGLSPEHVYSIAPGQLVPDNRLFGVLWMGRDALGQTANLDGAFSEAVVRLLPGADEAAVIDRLDRLLEPYGSVGAFGREDQISDAFVSSEIEQLATMGRLLPPIFLLVAAFLVNVVVSRLIATERNEIGLMKAFGYSDRAIVTHYLKLVGIIACLGMLIGGALGTWMGRALAGIFTDYYHFPFLVFGADSKVYFVVAGISLLAVGGGAFAAVRRAAALNPAEAMTAPPPPDFSKALGRQVTRWRLFDQQTRMILRQIVRWPSRALFTTAGVGVSVALLVGTLFFNDSMDEMVAAYFDVGNRHDVQVSFIEPRSRAALFDLLHAPGVLFAEPYRAIAVRMRHGHREERIGLTGSVDDPRLSRIVDSRMRPVVPPPGGLVLSSDLADKLHAVAGDIVEIRVTEGRRPQFEIPIAAVSTSYIGSGAQMPIEDLNRLLHEGPVISGAYLSVDALQTTALYRAMKSAPAVASVTLLGLAEENLTAVLDQSIGISIWMYTGFAAMIAMGVVYNSVRISFAERARELASLRVLGFSRGEVSYLLLGEIAFLTLCALPLGALLGTLMAWYLANAMSSDLFRLPFVILPSTYGYAAIVVLVVTAASGLFVRRQLDRMDLVSVLKIQE